MPRLPRITGRQLVAALNRAGFKTVRIEGSHYHLFKTGAGLVTIPVHAGETLSPRLVKSILRQAQLDLEELRQIL